LVVVHALRKLGTHLVGVRLLITVVIRVGDWSRTLARESLSLLDLLGQRSILAFVLVVYHENGLVVGVGILGSSVLACDVHDLLFYVHLLFVFVQDFVVVFIIVIIVVVVHVFIIHVTVFIKILVFVLFVFVIRECVPASDSFLCFLIVFANNLFNLLVDQIVLDPSVGLHGHVEVAVGLLFFLVVAVFIGESVVDVLFICIVHF
jgi:hypothetical protein